MAWGGPGFVELEEAEIGGGTRKKCGFEADKMGWVDREGVPNLAPGLTQHVCGAEYAVDGTEGGPGEIGLAGMSHDLIGSDLDLDRADGVAAWWRGGGCGGVGDVMNPGGIMGAVDQAEQGWRDVDGVGDEADAEFWKIERAPEDVVVSVEELRTGITEMSEAGGAGAAGKFEEVSRGIGMAEADAAAEFDGELDGRNGAVAFGGDGEEQRVGTGGGAQFADMRGGRIRHVGGIVCPAIAGFGGEKGAFDMPAGNGRGQLGEGVAQGVELLEPVEELLPVVSDEGEEESAATSLLERAGGLEQRGGVEIVLLEVDAGETIDLQIHQGGSEPGKSRLGGGRGRLEVGDLGGVPGDPDGLVGGVMSGDEGSHGRILVRRASRGQDL